MGCIFSKTTTGIPTVNGSVKKSSPQNIKYTQEQDTCTQMPSSMLFEQQTNKKVKDEGRPSKSNTSTTQPQINETPVSYNIRQATTALVTTDNRPMSTDSTKSIVHQKMIVSNTALNRLHKLKSHQDIDSISSISAKLHNLVQFRKTRNDVVVESFISNNSEDIVPNDTPSESNSHTNDATSSSSFLSNTEKAAMRQEALIRFMSAKSKHNSAHLKLSLNDNSIDSDESFPIYKSISSSTASNGEDSLIQQEITDQATMVDRLPMEGQQEVITNGKSNQSDTADLNFGTKNNPRSNDKETISVPRISVIKSLSPRVVIESNIQKQTIVYEVSSDPDDV
ncbi:unnamed protein product [Rotaria socialis]|uniref:Uncharacterized protein n=1 Tax=Rotaria socialis TaxID=392032 RepID=A0A817ZH55_9BILA|nr:unnamed protein product [Rotaria socialis]CAF4263095.1 unnamed protein product [Rotaria socialis]